MESQYEESLSPSKITQYFDLKKNRRKKGTSKKCEDSSDSVIKANSVYLTPESSPASVDEDHDQDSNDRQDQELSQSTAIFSNVSKLDNADFVLPAEIAADLENVVSPAESEPVCAELTVEDISSDETNIEIKADLKTVAASKSNSSSAKETQSLKSPTAPPSADSPSIPRSKHRKHSKVNQTASKATSSDSKPVKSKRGRKKKAAATPPPQTNTITDYFPVRRSGRQTKSEVALEKQMLLEKLILTNCEDGLQIEDFPDKGRGIIATKCFDAGDFVCEYSGTLMDLQSAREKEQEYSKDPKIGCYMYFFKCGDRTYCVDATTESDRLGRLLNHSRFGNCHTKSLMVAEIPRLILVAKRDIASGEELTYDYGDRSKAAIEAHPWLKL